MEMEGRFLESDIYGTYHRKNKYSEFEMSIVPYRHYKNSIMWCVFVGNKERQEHINVVAFTANEAVRLALEYADKYIKLLPEIIKEDDELSDEG